MKNAQLRYTPASVEGEEEKTVQNKTAGRQMGLILVACLAMSWVEAVWKPGYAAKALCKLPLFLGIPLLFSAPGRPAKS